MTIASRAVAFKQETVDGEERLESARVDELHPGQVDFDGALRQGDEPHQVVNEVPPVTEIEVAVNASDHAVIADEFDRPPVHNPHPQESPSCRSEIRAPRTPRGPSGLQKSKSRLDGTQAAASLIGALTAA